MAHTAEATNRVSTPPPPPPKPDGMLVHRSVTFSIKFAGTHLDTWERGTARVKRLAQDSKPEPLDPESSAQTIRSLQLLSAVPLTINFDMRRSICI